MKKIPLTQGYEALVDDEDYEYLSQWKWNILKNRSGNLYANRLSYENGYKNRKRILMHRLLNNTPDGMDTDHINGNSLDNRKCNLRTATREQNQWNRFANKKGSSKYKGVYWHKQSSRWRASIQVKKRRIHLGNFVTQQAAAVAYVDAAKKYFKEFNKENYYGRPNSINHRK